MCVFLLLLEVKGSKKYKIPCFRPTRNLLLGSISLNYIFFFNFTEKYGAREKLLAESL